MSDFWLDRTRGRRPSIVANNPRIILKLYVMEFMTDTLQACGLDVFCRETSRLPARFPKNAQGQKRGSA